MACRYDVWGILISGITQFVEIVKKIHEIYKIKKYFYLKKCQN